MPAEIHNKLIVETPENIFLEFELAGLGSRFLAYLIDTIIQVLILLGVFYVGTVLFGTIGLLAGSPNMSGTLMSVLSVLALFVVYEGYFIFFETRWQGQSVGKKILHLRVVKDEGYPVSFWDSVLRNLLRVVDAMPPLSFFPSYGLGSAVLLSNRQAKRVGDFVAGTLVIKERPYHGFEHLSSIQTNPAYVQNIHITNLNRLTDLDVYLLREFFFRKNTWPPDVRQELANKLSDRLRTKLVVSSPTYTNPVRFLDDLMLLLEYRRT